MFKQSLCFDVKYPKAASVKWYACRENSHKEGSSCATAPTASSEMLIQSANFNETILGDKQAQRPPSLKSLQQKISNSYKTCKN